MANVDLANATKVEIMARTPCCGMAKDTFSGSFDFALVPASGTRAPLRMTSPK